MSDATMPANFADALLAKIAEKGSPVCVGIDPVFERLPDELREDDVIGVEQTGMLGEFCYDVLEAVAPVAAAVKIQSAYFEAYGPVGVDLYFNVVEVAQSRGLLVIGDIKRGDIGSTARAYAQAHMAGPSAPDAITVNGYFGEDGLKPFVDVAAELGEGVFVLVRTSNPSAAAIQDFAGADGTKFHEHMARQVAAMGSAKDLIGQSGYSCVGAVVAATYPHEARRLREIMPQQLFLVPGYGAQGATAADCAAAFKPDGTGAIVNASRSVIYAYENEQYKNMKWQGAVKKAARAFADDIRKALRL
ncbi:MAG: orotidine-5'-phosphate decarboxylase [Phycisphaerae bacterium]|nr:orotidine-5'-phosphate decarboxylase [Phycisphaerae bacterium]